MSHEFKPGDTVKVRQDYRYRNQLSGNVVFVKAGEEIRIGTIENQDPNSIHDLYWAVRSSGLMLELFPIDSWSISPISS